MNSIELKVTKSTMSVSNIYTLNQGEYNVDKCVFDFSNDYEDLIKKAVFIYNDEDPIEMVILDNECNIPYELLQVATEFTLKVYAYEVKNNELVQRYSPTPLKIFLREGSYQGSNEVITPSQFEQYEAKLDEGLDDVADALDDVNTALQTMATATEETNRLNIDVSDKVDKDVTITLTKKDNTTKSVVISDGDDFQYNWDGTRLGVKTDKEESYSYVDLQGQQGPMGPQGEAFQIKKTYTTIQQMVADYDNMNVNDYVMISGSVEQQDNATLWVKTETEDPTYKWVYLADFSGASGIQGPTGATPNIQIGNVTQGDTPNVTRRGTDENPILDFTLVKGDKGNTGNTGPTGNGISSVEKISTSGLVDTYRQTYTNGEYFDYDVTNGANGSVTDVQVEGTSVVDNGVANIVGLATQAELDYYKTIYNVLPKVSGNGENITLDNTANSVMKINPKGQCKQETTTGKQLLEYPYYETSKSLNGVTFTANQDGSVLVNGIPTGVTYIILENKMSIQPNTEYTLSGIDESYNLVFYIAEYNSNDEEVSHRDNVQGEYTFTTTNTTSKILVQLKRKNNNVAINNITIYPQLELGSTATSFEPYTGGIASPNPNYPQQIHEVSGDNTIKIEGKNLVSSYSRIGNQMYLNGTTSTTNYIFKPGTYTISYKKNTSSYAYIFMRKPSSSSNESVGNANPITFTSDENFNVWIYISDMQDNDVSDIQLELGSTATSYEPYNRDTYELSLGDIKMRGIGTYEDYFVRNSGKNIANSSDYSYTFPANENTLHYLGTVDLVAGTTYYYSYDVDTATTSSTRNTPFFKLEDNSYYQSASTNNNLAIGKRIWEFTPSTTGTYSFGYWVHTPNVAVTISRFMIATTNDTIYEPYGIGLWCKYNAVRHLSLAIANMNNSEDYPGWTGLTQLKEDYPNYGGALNTKTDYKCNIITQSLGGINLNTQGSNAILWLGKTVFNNQTQTQWKTNYPNLVFELYYGLQTPYLSLIESTTLQNRLDKLEKALSKDGQTNISQVNNDAPFIIDASALRSMTDYGNSL